LYPRLYVDRPWMMRQYAGERVIAGVNRLTADGEEVDRPLRFDPAPEAEQAARRKQKDDTAVGRALSALKSRAEGTGNVLYPASRHDSSRPHSWCGLRRAAGRMGHRQARRF
jgi:methylmalonyl-CoA mutase N-terminal domain/subunit